jgi:molybdate transport system ATP-binding protein
VAALVGLNLYRGTAGDDGVRLACGGRLVAADRTAGEVLLAFPPSAVAVYGTRPQGSPRNTWPVRVAGMERHADTIRLSLRGAPDVLADLTAAAVADLSLAPDSQVWAAVKATEIRAYPA